MSAIDQLDRRTRASLAEASVMRRPFGPILQQATLSAMSLEQQRLVRPSEVTAFFDGLSRYARELTPKPNRRGRKR